MKIEQAQNGMRVKVVNELGTILFTHLDSFYGKYPLIRVMLDKNAHKVKGGYDGEGYSPEQVEIVNENFRPEDVTLV